MRTQQTAKHRSDQRPGVSACQVLKTRTEPHTSWGPHLLTWVYLLGLKRNVWTYPTRRYITIESKSINENPADCQTQVRPASRRFCMSSFENPDGASHVLGTSFIDLESFAWAQKKSGWTYPTQRYIAIESKLINANTAACQTRVRPLVLIIFMAFVHS